MLRFNQLTWY